MGEGDQRRTKRTARYDSRELAHLVRKHTRTEADWDRDFPVDLATGTQPLSTVDSRTQTVDDPLTTSVLAEIARRAMTLDLPAAEPVEPMDDEPASEESPASDLAAPADPTT